MASAAKLNVAKTQALLDALALRHALRERGEAAEDFTGLTVTICGDVLHSRVARSNLLCLQALGATVRLCAPPALMPAGVEALGAQPFHDFDAALADSDVVMMLRLQTERMQGQFIASAREYRDRNQDAQNCKENPPPPARLLP